MDDRWTLSVSELNEYVRKRLAGDPLLRTVEVAGEISNYKHHISGHRYFALKDEGARVACVMLRTQAEGLDFRPEDGMRVTVRASASIYVRDGSYQLYVNSMRLSGAGELYLRFEALKKKLAQEGLFDPARKQPIPLFPRVLGVATSEDGAAIRDILRVARARNPRIEIVLAPCAVQGASAAAEIVRAIEHLNRDGRSEVILVGRGGGSLEDLWPFNEEIVARAIAASAIPVISCVGHEIDFTIADFAADVRAATPSNAAELAVPVVAEMREAVRQLGGRLGYALRRAQQLRLAWLEAIGQRPWKKMPERILLEPRAARLGELQSRMSLAMERGRERRERRLQLADRALRALDPTGVLRRGYAVVRREGRCVTGAALLRPGDAIRVQWADGSVAAEVKELENERDDI